MKLHFVNILFLIILAAPPLQGQDNTIEYIGIPELDEILENPADRLYVVNFWATWCAPCVKEFPYFEKVSKEYDNSRVSFIMISLDFPSQVEKQLIPFLKKNNASLKVAVMTDMDYNSWIDRVDSSWQGDIPATLIFNNMKKVRHFHPGEVNEMELRKLVNDNL